MSQTMPTAMTSPQPDLLQRIKADLPNGQSRVETGPLQINLDWPGVFVRGDNAFAYALALESAISQLKHGQGTSHRDILVAQLNGLLNLLRSCDVRGDNYKARTGEPT